MREPSSIVSTCFRHLSIDARAARQALGRCSPFAGLRRGAGSDASLGQQSARSSAEEFDLKMGHFQQGRRRPCIVEYNDGTHAAVISGTGGLDLRRRSRRTERPDDRLDAWLARPHLAVPRCKRAGALDYGDDANRKGTVRCGAAAAVHRDCELLHGIKLGERSLLPSGAASRRRS